MVLIEQIDVPTKNTVMLLTRKKYIRSAAVFQKVGGKKVLRLEVLDEDTQKKYSMHLPVDALNPEMALSQVADMLLTDLVDTIYEASKNALNQVKDGYATFLDIFMG